MRSIASWASGGIVTSFSAAKSASAVLRTGSPTVKRVLSSGGRAASLVSSGAAIKCGATGGRVAASRCWIFAISARKVRYGPIVCPSASALNRWERVLNSATGSGRRTKLGSANSPSGMGSLRDRLDEISPVMSGSDGRSRGRRQERLPYRRPGRRERSPGSLREPTSPASGRGYWSPHTSLPTNEILFRRRPDVGLPVLRGRYLA